MAENVINFRGTRAQLRKLIAKAVAVASGHGGDAGEAQGQMQVRLGLTALANIKKAFIVKAAGGTDEAGLRWPPLAKSTVAYSRRHPGVPKNVKGSPNRASFAPSFMLTVKQRKRWWQLMRIVGPARAWIILKDEGAKTLIGEYGDAPAQILRDTGLLLNSLSPGVESAYAPSSPPSVEDQVFKVGSGEVIVGTNRKHARAHHEGTSRIPQRRLWPMPSTWPQSWWDDLSESGRTGMIDILLHLLRNL